ncbi:hypothetical protein NDU88_002531 [Pleurodeles waltl]|uniref:Uncharacterized protein n=1 Tax=Pleurodeles waltl TaxID=8319 RepID=A0AAV7UXH2_PLEWA|nr:hypothetical protein NDU88_002531 [Pleurodeles waltl]
MNAPALAQDQAPLCPYCCRSSYLVLLVASAASMRICGDVGMWITVAPSAMIIDGRRRRWLTPLPAKNQHSGHHKLKEYSKGHRRDREVEDADPKSRQLGSVGRNPQSTVRNLQSREGPEWQPPGGLWACDRGGPTTAAVNSSDKAVDLWAVPVLSVRHLTPSTRQPAQAAGNPMASAWVLAGAQRVLGTAPAP